MNLLVSGLEKLFISAVEEFCLKISEEHNEIKSNDLERIWNDTCSTSKISISFNNSNKTQKKSNSKSDSKTENSTETCLYIFSKGAKKGTCCITKPKENNYCSKHKAYSLNNSPPSTPSSISSKISINSKKSTSSKKEKLPIKPQSTQLMLRMHKQLNKLWHPESKLIFKSSEEKIVIGILQNNKIKELSNDDINECKKWGFPYDQGINLKIKSKPDKKINNSDLSQLKSIKKTIKNGLGLKENDTDEDEESKKNSENNLEEDVSKNKDDSEEEDESKNKDDSEEENEPKNKDDSEEENEPKNKDDSEVEEEEEEEEELDDEDI
jgi:hypothetical protein